MAAEPIKVAVLVDLALTPEAGGHVKCWERFAEAAALLPNDLDLTVHFSGAEAGERRLAGNVRYRIHRPVFSTARLPFLSHVPDHTDLARRHSGLAAELRGIDVIHTTDAFFAFARTAERVARENKIPLVTCINTDTPSYTRVFTAQTIQRLLGKGRMSRLFIGRLHLPERAEADMLRRLARHQARCAQILVSRADDLQRALAVLPPERIGYLRRGIDKAAFNPAKRDRAALERALGVPRDKVLVLYAGRLDRGKNVMTLARAVRMAVDRGAPLHLLCAGRGEDREAIMALLGPHATCPGPVPQPRLQAWYAGADVFALPSRIETFGNVVIEAQASGVAALVAAEAGTERLIRPGTGLALPAEDVAAWADALVLLAGDRARLTAMGRDARAYVERDWPSWGDVLTEDLLPRWRAAAGERRPE